MSALAAIVFKPGENVDALVAAFADKLKQHGFRVDGVTQANPPERDCANRAIEAVNLSSGKRLAILQDLGRQTKSCRVDPAAIADIAQMLTQALARKPDLLLINRFGRLEAENAGIINEIGAAFEANVPSLICVSTRYLDAWNNFAHGMDAQLPCAEEALDAWWQQVLATREPIRA